jgi:hypothetical protein
MQLLELANPDSASIELSPEEGTLNIPIPSHGWQARVIDLLVPEVLKDQIEIVWNQAHGAGRDGALAAL